MTSTMSQFCACRVHRIPYGSTAVVADDHSLHRLSACAGKPAPAVPTPAPQLLRTTCSHGVDLWVTGPDPAALLAEAGCGCDVAA